jgi:hypothetical protein
MRLPFLPSLPSSSPSSSTASTIFTHRGGILLSLPGHRGGYRRIQGCNNPSLSQDSLASQRRISVKYPSGGGWRRRGGSQRSGRRRGGFRRLLHLCRVNAAANRSRVRGCPPPREKGKNVDPGLAVGGGGENLLMGWWRPAEWIAPAGWSTPCGGSVRIRTAALPGSVWSRLPSRYSTSGWPR